MEQVIALLIAERERVNRALEALQPMKRRGRPAKDYFTGVYGVTANKLGGLEIVKHRKTRTWTPAQRKAKALHMKAFWAKKRKAA